MGGVMMQFLVRRKARKEAAEALRHARHFRHMREDIMPAADLARLQAAESALQAALAAPLFGTDAVRRETDTLMQTITDLAPRVEQPGLRENIEVLVVAVAVAMAFRAYFIQPFKIPTGSMEPTLNGIHSAEVGGPRWHDRFPLSAVKWLATGDWYHRIRAQESGPLEFVPELLQSTPAYVVINGRRHKVPTRARFRYEWNQVVPRGGVLWSGIVTAGDHVFVNKLKWNFCRPRRGDIVVFFTKGIDALEATLPRDNKGRPISTHYIKRLVGMPGERINIRRPHVYADDKALAAPEGIGRVSASLLGYHAAAAADAFLGVEGQEQTLTGHEYLVLGDNTGNSRDSRYWGPVPERCMVGPACFVYWPFSKHWGVPK